MKRVFFVVLVSAALIAPLSANGLIGFGLVYGLDSEQNDIPIIGTTVTTYSGLGFNVDTYIGQRLGFYAGAAFGLLTGISVDYEVLDPVKSDMANYTTEIFGNALLGLGTFIPLGRFDLSGAIGFGITGSYYEYSSDFLDPVGRLNAGPGVAINLGIPVSSKVEATLGCRAVYGMIQLTEESSAFKYDLSITPALGVRMKF